jgi:hypothetical protein
MRGLFLLPEYQAVYIHIYTHDRWGVRYNHWSRIYRITVSSMNTAHGMDEQDYFGTTRNGICTTTSISALGSTHLRDEWVPETLPLGNEVTA